MNDNDIPVKVKVIVTQEDKKVGRKQILTPTPVKKIAQRHNLPIVTLSHGFTVNNETMKQFSNVDLSLLFAYGEIIPENLLKAPKHGFWNVHPSLLPKYRGPAPVAAPLIIGDRETGVTLIKMDEKLDHGPIIAQEKLEILPKEKRPELTMRLVDLGYEMFNKTITQLIRHSGKRSASRNSKGSWIHSASSGQASQDDVISFKEQDHSRATYTQLLTKKDGYIEFENLKLKIENSPNKLFNQFRGLYPWPGIWTLVKFQVPSSKFQEKRLKITDMDLIDGKLIIKKVQLEGKNEVDFETFKRAYRLF